MFSQLTALAKSATDFSLDNLQENENEDREKSPRNESDDSQSQGVNSKENSTNDDVVSEDVSSASSSFTNMFASSSTKFDSNVDKSLNESQSGTFTTLFSSTSTTPSGVSSPPTSDPAPTASSVSSSFNKLFDYSFSGKDSSSNKADSLLQNDKNKSDEVCEVNNEDVASSSVKAIDNETRTDDDLKSLADPRGNNSSKVTKSPTKAKKGSGREAARLLEKQLRRNIAELQENLLNKSEQLELANSNLKRVSGDLEETRDNIANKEAVIADLTEKNIDLKSNNDSLERELDSLRGESILHLQEIQELKLRNVQNDASDDVGSPKNNEDSSVEDVPYLQEKLRALQHKIDSDANIHKAELNKEEKNWTSKLSTSESKTKELKAVVTNLQTEVESLTMKLKEERTTYEVAVEKKDNLRSEEIAAFEEKMRSLVANAEQLQEENRFLQSALDNQFEETSKEIVSSKDLIKEKQETIDRLEKELQAGEVKHNELKEKFASFTEKTKVQVKKFIESQKAADEEKRLVSNALEARESEIVSLRLKLDTADDTLSNRKALSSELAERYSELQREMQRKSEELVSKDARSEDLLRQISVREKEIESLTSRVAELSSELTYSRTQASSDLEKYRAEIVVIQNREQEARTQEKKSNDLLLSETQHRLVLCTEECDVLQQQVATLEEQVANGLGNKKSLEEYKSRAQKAIKQANTASAVLTTELSEANENIENLESQLTSVTEELDSTRSSIQVLRSEMEAERNDAQNTKDLLEAKSSRLQDEVHSLQSSLKSAVDEMKKLKEQQQQLTELPDKRNTVQSTRESLDPSNNVGPGFRKPMKSSSNKTAVVVPVRQSAASTAVNKTENSGKSVDSISNDSDCVLVSDTMDYLEVDGNAQSDVENGGSVSESSSVVVQWNNILPRHSANMSPSSESPNSNVAAESSSPFKKHSIDLNADLNKDSSQGSNKGNVVPKVESLLSITSCSSDGNEMYSHDTGGSDRRRDNDDDHIDDAPKGQHYFFVTELKRELHRLRQELSKCHMTEEELRRSSTAAEDARVQAVRDYNELKAFHERTKKLLNSPDSAMNIEYLKKCIFRLMITKELSERSRLYPVISTLLKFTPVETREVNAAIQEEVLASGSMIPGVSPSVWQSASSTLGGLFGGGTAMVGTVTSTGEVIGEEDSIANNSMGDNASSWW